MLCLLANPLLRAAGEYGMSIVTFDDNTKVESFIEEMNTGVDAADFAAFVAKLSHGGLPGWAGTSWAEHTTDWGDRGYVVKNQSGRPIDAAGAYHEAGQVCLGPARSGLRQMAVGYLAATPGTYRISARFTGQNTDAAAGGTSARVYVGKKAADGTQTWFTPGGVPYLGGGVTLDGFIGRAANNYTDGFGTVREYVFTTDSLYLNVGDYLYFGAIYTGEAEEHAKRSVLGLDASVQGPEPSDLADAFSAASNPNDPWVFGFVTGEAQDLVPFTVADDKHPRLDQAPRPPPYFAGPESRDRIMVRLYDTIPKPWLALTPETMSSFKATARPGEYFAFQVGVCALRQELRNVRAAVSTLTTVNGDMISENLASCITLGGIDFQGQPFVKPYFTIDKGEFAPLWFLIKVPETAAGVYQGEVWISPSNAHSTRIGLKLTVDGVPLPDHGVGREYAMSKLAWFDSTAGLDDRVTKEFVPLRREGMTLALLGREVTLAKSGLPEGINSFFTGANQTLKQTGDPILSKPMGFALTLQDGATVKLENMSFAFTQETDAEIRWRSVNAAPEALLTVEGMLGFDGYMDYHLTVKFLQDLELFDLRAEIAMTERMSRYMMGLGFRGDLRPQSHDFSWDQVDVNAQDSLWLGSANGGLFMRFVGPESHRPLSQVNYKFGPLRRPVSWGNFGKGGVRMRAGNGVTTLTAFSGARAMQAGHTLDFGLEMNITPLKLLQDQKMFGDRIMHGTPLPIDEAKRIGANIMIIHQGRPSMEYINWPLYEPNRQQLKAQIDEADTHGIRYKLYYTARETSLRCPELVAASTFDGEIMQSGPGEACRTVVLPRGPHPWIQQTFKKDYVPGWFTPLPSGVGDLSMSTAVDSRWDNFYLAGLEYLLKEYNIGGIYVDDSTLSRSSMMRARKLIDQHTSNGHIDLHSWDSYNHLAGWKSSLLGYVQQMAYIDSLWIGEGRNYDASPAEWLVEASGIPFGLSSQMLRYSEGGGNPWRGMLFGMTVRYKVGGTPEHIWKLWDDFGIVGCRIDGFWDEAAAVRSSNPDGGVTTYVKNGKALIAAANWVNRDIRTTLEIDWNRLGLEEALCSITQPPIEGFQEGRASVDLSGELDLPGGRGFMFVVTESQDATVG